MYSTLISSLAEVPENTLNDSTETAAKYHTMDLKYRRNIIAALRQRANQGFAQDFMKDKNYSRIRWEAPQPTARVIYLHKQTLKKSSKTYLLGNIPIPTTLEWIRIRDAGVVFEQRPADLTRRLEGYQDITCYMDDAQRIYRSSQPESEITPETHWYIGVGPRRAEPSWRHLIKSQLKLQSRGKWEAGSHLEMHPALLSLKRDLQVCTTENIPFKSNSIEYNPVTGNLTINGELLAGYDLEAGMFSWFTYAGNYTKQKSLILRAILGLHIIRRNNKLIWSRKNADFYIGQVNDFYENIAGRGIPGEGVIWETNADAVSRSGVRETNLGDGSRKVSFKHSNVVINRWLVNSLRSHFSAVFDNEFEDTFGDIQMWEHLDINKVYDLPDYRILTATGLPDYQIDRVFPDSLIVRFGNPALPWMGEHSRVSIPVRNMPIISGYFLEYFHAKGGLEINGSKYAFPWDPFGTNVSPENL